MQAFIQNKNDKYSIKCALSCSKEGSKPGVKSILTDLKD